MCELCLCEGQGDDSIAYRWALSQNKKNCPQPDAAAAASFFAFSAATISLYRLTHSPFVLPGTSSLIRSHLSGSFELGNFFSAPSRQRCCSSLQSPASFAVVAGAAAVAASSASSAASSASSAPAPS